MRHCLGLGKEKEFIKLLSGLKKNKRLDIKDEQEEFENGNTETENMPVNLKI